MQIWRLNLNTEIFLTTAAQRKGTRIVEQLFAESLAQISRGVIIDKYHVGQQKLRELSLMKQYYVRCAFSHNVASISVWGSKRWNYWIAGSRFLSCVCLIQKGLISLQGGTLPCWLLSFHDSLIWMRQLKPNDSFKWNLSNCIKKYKNV